jgi:hypothetical protein
MKAMRIVLSFRACITLYLLRMRLLLSLTG